MEIIGNAKHLGKFKLHSPEWHAARAEHIGGSEIASILGLSSFKSAYTLWHEKAGLITPEPVSPDMARKQAYGHHMEPFVTQLFLDQMPEWAAEETGTWRNVERAWQGCNPDRILNHLHGGGPSLLQIKTGNFEADWEDGVPPGYLAQVKWEMDTFGFTRGYLAAYFNVGGGFRVYEIDLDPFEANWMREQALKFAESLTGGEPPEIDGSTGTLRTVARLNPSIDKGREVIVPEDVAMSYLQAVDAAKTSAGELNRWKGHVLAHMGTAQYAVFDGKRIASRSAIRDGVPFLKEA
jgi:putative phage-type endonuclease